MERGRVYAPSRGGQLHTAFDGTSLILFLSEPIIDWADDLQPAAADPTP